MPSVFAVLEQRGVFTIQENVSFSELAASNAQLIEGIFNDLAGIVNKHRESLETSFESSPTLGALS